MWGNTFALAGQIKGTLLAWIGALVLAATVTDQFGFDREAILPLTILGVFAQTQIVVAALRAGSGEAAQAAIRPQFGRVFGIGILSGFAILLGGLLLIVPGVLLLIRWWVAVPLALDRDVGASQSLNESWALTAAHWAPILGLFLGLLVLVGVPALALGMVGGLADQGVAWPLTLATNLVTYGVTNFGTVSTVAVYRAISDRTTDLRAVFE